MKRYFKIKTSQLKKINKINLYSKPNSVKKYRNDMLTAVKIPVGLAQSSQSSTNSVNSGKLISLLTL